MDIKLGPVREALEVTLTSDAKLREDRHAALVALARVTADQIDQAGDEVSSRLIASYLSALKDVEKALGGRAAAPGEGDVRGTLGKLQALTGGRVS